MSTTKTSSVRTGAPPYTQRTVLWGVRILLATIFAAAALPKLAGVHSAMVMFDQIGAGRWLMYLVGLAELAGAIGLLVPRLRAFAALGLAADMVGATVVNITVLHSAAVAFTVPLCVACVIVAWVHSGARSVGAGEGRPISEAP
jgi:putative oxidoreductase